MNMENQMKLMQQLQFMIKATTEIIQYLTLLSTLTQHPSLITIRNKLTRGQ
eukprot:403340469